MPPLAGALTACNDADVLFCGWKSTQLCVEWGTVGWTFNHTFKHFNDLVLYIRSLFFIYLHTHTGLRKILTSTLPKPLWIASRCTPKQLTRDYFAETLVLITFSESKYLVYLFWPLISCGFQHMKQKSAATRHVATPQGLRWEWVSRMRRFWSDPKWEVGIWSFRCLMLLAGLIIIPDQWIFGAFPYTIGCEEDPQGQ